MDLPLLSCFLIIIHHQIQLLLNTLLTHQFFIAKNIKLKTINLILNSFIWNLGFPSKKIKLPEIEK